MGLKRFDYKLKDNTKKKSIIVASIIVLVLIIGVTVYATYAAYKVTKTYNIIQGKVAEFANADIKINVIAIDTEGNATSVKDFPSFLEYNYLANESSCTNGSTIEFDEAKWSATISTSGKDTCTLKFEQRSTKTLADAIKANTTLITKTPNFSIPATDENTNLYQAEDDLGTSYYFRGAPTNNYVQFGTYAEDTTINSYVGMLDGEKTVEVKAGDPMYWRIVRINGDGTVRLIYDGIEKEQNGVGHVATIASTAFNENYDDVKYVGYTYDVNGTVTDSKIKDVVDLWYEKHLEANYGGYIEDEIFCNDRTIATTNDNGNIYYASYHRIKTNAPVLTCTNKSDRYTVDITKGNGYLSNPVGLLTADEAAFAGAVSTDGNNLYYLYSGELYWTSSPDGLTYDRYNRVSGTMVTPAGNIQREYVLSEFGARPVINLDANIEMYGSGTISDPYRLTKEL